MCEILTGSKSAQEKILNVFVYVNNCVQSWYKSNTCPEYVIQKKERLINWEKVKYNHFNSTNVFSIVIALKGMPDHGRPATPVWVFFFN